MASNGPAPDVMRVLVTGANSGLGFGICQRLIDKFLQTHPSGQHLCIIITTRDTKKGDDTVKRLQAYLGRAERASSTARKLTSHRVEFQQEILDLNSILSVQRLAKKLAKTVPDLDSIVLNAGIGGWSHVDWVVLAWCLITNWVDALTWPTFKRSNLGRLTKPQGSNEKGRASKEPPLGEIFCANLFGHYLLAHYLAPLLARCRHGNGRIIWLTSLEAYAHSFKPEDFQGLTHDLSYESSKRITDTLVLTSDSSNTSPYVRTYLQDENGITPALTTPRKSDPKSYVTHPGICATGIFPLPYILALGMEFAFYMARWLGSPWHACTPYKGATAPVWVALADQAALDSSEESKGKQKLGSSTDFWGNEKVEWTEVEGWGYGGIPEQTPSSRRGRWKHAKDMTLADKAEFEKLGATCWEEMERLRIEWEKRLQGVVNGV